MVNLTYQNMMNQNMMNENSPNNTRKPHNNFKSFNGPPQSIHSSKSRFSLEEEDEEDEDVNTENKIKNNKVKGISEISENSKVHFGFIDEKSKNQLSNLSINSSINSSN